MTASRGQPTVVIHLRICRYNYTLPHFFHRWRRPGSVPGHDPCGIAGGSHTNASFAAGGFGYTTGYPQGFPGSKLPKVPKDKQATWVAGGTAEVSWVSAANHGGGYM